MTHPAEKMNEILLCFDESGNVIEPHTRAEAHELPLKYWHAVSEVWVVNKNAQLLCSKRSELLSQKPGRWQTRFGGHAQADSTYEETALRELEEEAGLKIMPEDLYLIRDVRKNDEFKHLGKCYVCLFNGSLEEVKFNDGEVTEIRWMSMEDYEKEKSENPDAWTNGCSIEDQAAIKQWLGIV
jgi:isopentenyl-diphosphate Delta-isomerase